jgi:uncharacterized membrane protein YuzA (DUF378 family)
MKFDKVADVMLLVGGIAWGVYGVTGFFGESFNLVNAVSFGSSIVENSIYTLVGVSAVMKLLKKIGVSS